MKFTAQNRRQFLGDNFKNATGLAIGAALPGTWMQAVAHDAARSSLDGEKILVVIQLSGGNDGLNTIVPYGDEDYRKARPTLGISARDVIKLGDEVGVHPAMKAMMSLIESGCFSIVHGVGYPAPNRSHFESMDIWHSCQRKENRTDSGWLGRIFEKEFLDQNDSAGLHLGAESLPLALVGRGVQVPSIREVEQMKFKSSPVEQSMEGTSRQITQEDDAGELIGFLSASTDIALRTSQRIAGALVTSTDDSEFPESQLAEKLKVISRLIVAGLKTRVYYVTLDGFDTHANQLAAHQGLLRQWSEALAAFHKRLERAGESDRVLVMTFSEFGRRLKENASEGTDHGAAAPVFLSGPKLPRLQVGSIPSLIDLDDGDLKHHTDFRQVYASVIENWLGQSSEYALAGKHEPIVGLLS